MRNINLSHRNIKYVAIHTQTHTHTHHTRHTTHTHSQTHTHTPHTHTYAGRSELWGTMQILFIILQCYATPIISCTRGLRKCKWCNINIVIHKNINLQYWHPFSYVTFEFLKQSGLCGIWYMVYGTWYMVYSLEESVLLYQQQHLVCWILVDTDTRSSNEWPYFVTKGYLLFYEYNLYTRVILRPNTWQ